MTCIHPSFIGINLDGRYYQGKKGLTLCMLGNFSCFCCRLPTFFFPKLTFQKTSFRNTIRVPKKLEPDQDRHFHFVGPDLDSNCLQWFLSADDKVAAIKQGQS